MLISNIIRNCFDSKVEALLQLKVGACSIVQQLRQTPKMHQESFRCNKQRKPQLLLCRIKKIY